LNQAHQYQISSFPGACCIWPTETTCRYNWPANCGYLHQAFGWRSLLQSSQSHYGMV